MELYTHSKLSTVERERLELLKNCNKIQVAFVPFNVQSSDPFKNSPLHFNRACRAYYAAQSFYPGGFAPSPVQPSGVVGQGALLTDSWGLS